jgi:lipid A 4'-phosphatase
MSRTGLFIALAVGTVVGVLFALFPQLDLAISDLFFDRRADIFMFDRYPWLGPFRTVAMWIVAAIALPAALAPVIKLFTPRRPILLAPRATIFLLATLALAPGVMTNMVLKEYWGRPRPIDLRDFARNEPFVPWWDPRGGCSGNCSFVAGEGAGAFWTLAPAALAPAPLRPLAYAAAVAFGAAVGTLRIAFGGHFFTDVVFAGVFTFLIIWLAHGLIFRWFPTGGWDAAIERLLERVSLAVQGALKISGGRASTNSPPR